MAGGRWLAAGGREKGGLIGAGGERGFVKHTGPIEGGGMAMKG